jgi:hypothetical protein
MMKRALPIAALAACFEPKPMLGQPCSSWCPPPESCIAGTCELAPTIAGSADAPPPPVTGNYVFVTSETKTPSAIGGPEGGDAWCNQLAATAGLPGTYTAWISSTTEHARDRLAATGARGWYRVDGQPFADSLDDLVGSGRMFYPPRFAETGVDLGEVTTAVATGTLADGGDAGGFDCSGFTSSTGSVADGVLEAGKGFWTDYRINGNAPQLPCSAPVRIYCFGNTMQVAVTVPPQANVRHAFITQTGVGISAGGRGAIDATCASQAMAAGLPGTYEALLPSASSAANSRFPATTPWVRTDNVTTLSADLVTMFAPLDVDAFGVYEQGSAWIGEPMRDCTDWTTASGTVSTNDVAYGNLAESSAANCFEAHYAFCLEL